MLFLLVDAFENLASLVVWLKNPSPNAGGMGSIPGSEMSLP